MSVDKTLVDALIAPAQQHRARALCKVAHQRLVDAPAGGREMDHVRRGWVTISDHRRQRPLQRLGQQHHARATAERPVIDALVGALTVIAQRPQAHVDLPRFVGAPGHAEFEERLEQLRKQRDDIEAHAGLQKSRPQSTVMVRAFRSTSST